MKHKFSALFVIIILFITSCSEKRYSDPSSPEQALKSFQLREEFKIEIFAAEPEVFDPVEMVIDENGKTYVIEMPDYPFKPKPGEGKGRIRILTDTSGDGRMDKSIVFADKITEGTSMLPWKGGLLVTSAPHILYLKDTTGDGVADSREILFTGFFQDNSEAQITNLRFGVDNWIYASNFGQPGTVKFNRRPDAPALSMTGGDFRFRLDLGLFELASGGAQFGQTMDDWGHRFVTQNTLHIRQVIIPWHYLHRHPYLPSTNSLVNISDHELATFQLTAPPYWRAERTRRRQKEFDEKKLNRTEYAEDHFSGASGGTFYGGDAFPKEYYGNIFTGEVMGNLLHRDIISKQTGSPVLVVSRDEGEKNREFLASTDPWFRPVGFAQGPDGNLYVIDMYRQHIETPLSIPEDLKADMDFLKGSQLGRIYRISPKNSSAQPSESPNLGSRNSRELVKLLAHPNQWWRLQAQRLLLERQDKSVLPELTELFQKHADPRTRLHAFYALDGMNALNPVLVEQAMHDVHPGVREHGAKLSERYPTLLPQLIRMTDDASVQVVFQACLSLGEFSGKPVIKALAGVLEKYGTDTWFQTGVLSSEAGSSLPFLELVADRRSFLKETSPERLGFLDQSSFVVAARNRDGEISKMLTLLSSKPALKDDKWKKASLTGLARGLKNYEPSAENDAKLEEILRQLEVHTTPLTRNLLGELRAIVKTF